MDQLVEEAPVLVMIKESCEVAEEVCNQESAGPVADVNNEPVQEEGP